MSSQHLEVGGVRLHVETAGDGPPLLLLHGWPQDGRVWEQVVPRLQDRFTLVVLDWRGHGRSADAPDGVYTPDALVAEALGVLDALGIGRAGVIGHDWGCFVSLLLAVGAPERVTAVLAAGSPHPWIPVTAGGALSLWRGWYAALNAFGVATGVTGRHVLGPEVAAERYLATTRAPATKALYRWYWGSWMRLLRDGPPPAPAVPVRYLVGEHDPCTPASWVGDGVPGAGVEWVPGAGHSLPEERPDLLAARALALFGRSVASRACAPPSW